MTAQVLDGKAIAERIKRQLVDELAKLPTRPQLRVLYFNTPASGVYWLAQRNVAASVEIGTGTQAPFSERNSQCCDFNSVTPQQVESIIERWNRDPEVHGVFIHQPLPPQLDAQWISTIIDPRKDIEGIHPQNSARRFFAKGRIGSCTALAVMELIESTGVDLAGKEAVVVGHSEIVGRPVSMLLLDQLATVTVCHVATRQLEEHVKRADIVVVAIGKPRVITGEWIKRGAIVIDVGINVIGGKVVGDVEFEAAKQRAAFISPVPGGVGPVTVVMVMKNTLEAFKLQHA